MSRILQIDSSSRSETSVTRQLTSTFVQQWLKVNPEHQVLERDLIESQPPFVTELGIQAMYTPPEKRDAAMQQAISASVALVSEFVSADVYVIGAPMYNFGIPAALKAYIDLVVVPGKTFAYVDGRPAPLLHNKKAIIVTASGGDYTGPMASLNFVEPYLRSILGFIGITDVQVVAVRGHNPEQVEAGTKAALLEIVRIIDATRAVAV